ncbi:hypothetical protein [Pseudoxanthomonas putridarboris]|uniref:Uncharacterized protein n=1 Tax=Pseudoxanthomonas putridarboris TaxID=752605 RepID=A0ABU9J178_9GAMM
MLDVATLHRRACRVLPEKIQTCGVLAGAMDEPRLAVLLLPLARRRQGGIAYRLAAATLAALAADPLAYLQDAYRAREGLGRRIAPLLYGAWRQVGHGGMACFHTVSRDGRASLALLPARKRAVYAWNDHGLAGDGILAP